MKRFRTAPLLLMLGLLIGSADNVSMAVNIDYTHITISDSSPGFNADFDVSNIPRNVGNLPDTNGFGYASAGAGADTFVDFAFDQPYPFNEITVIDRVHSGAAADTIGGTADFVTEYDLILSTNNVFGDGDDTVVSVGPLTVPAAPTGVEDFTSVAAIGGIEAQYIRYDIVSTNGANPGAHAVLFDAVPEPSSLTLIVIGMAAIVRRARRK